MGSLPNCGRSEAQQEKLKQKECSIAKICPYFGCLLTAKKQTVK
jgi:hypothetical protein